MVGHHSLKVRNRGSTPREGAKKFMQEITELIEKCNSLISRSKILALKNIDTNIMVAVLNNGLLALNEVTMALSGIKESLEKIDVVIGKLEASNLLNN